MKIAVNSGNVGTPVAITLAKQGHEVALMVRKIEKSPELDSLKIKQVTFDIKDVKSMELALQGAEAFFSLTPLVQNLVECGTNAIHAAKKAGVRKIVRSSALGAGPNAAIQLGRLHFAVEQALESSGLSFSVIRPANFMQNFLSFGNPETIKFQNSFYAPMGEGKVSMIDTRDLSALAAKLLIENGHEEKRYEITGAEALSNTDVAKLFSEALQKQVKYVDIPESAAKEGMQKAQMPDWIIELLTELNSIGKAGYLGELKPDFEKVMGRKPTSFAQFIQDHLGVFS